MSSSNRRKSSTKSKKIPKSSVLHETERVYKNRSETVADFKSFDITITKADTAALLLRCSEEEVLLRILQNFDNFGLECPGNLEILRKLQLVQLLLQQKLLEHTNSFIKRFSWKILAILLANFKIKYEEIVQKEIFTLTCDLYADQKDIYLAEYASRILLLFIEDPRVCLQLRQDSKFLIHGINEQLKICCEPDVLLFAYKIFVKILRNGGTYIDVAVFENFPIEKSLGHLLRSDFPEIQKEAAFSLKQILIYSGNYFVKKLGCAAVFEEFFKILEDSNSQDLHIPIVYLIEQCVTHREIAGYFLKEFLNRYKEFLFKTDQKSEAIKVITEISTISESFQIIFELGLPQVFCDILAESSNRLNPDIFHGIQNLAKHKKAMEIFIEKDVTKVFIATLKNDVEEWETRTAAAQTLLVFTDLSLRSNERSLQLEFSSKVAKFFSKPNGVSLELMLCLLKILSSMAKDSGIRAKLMTPELANSLVVGIENSFRSTVLLTAFLRCMSNFLCEPKFLEILQENFHRIILRCLKHSAISTKTAASDFAVLTANNCCFNKHYIQADGVLEHLLTDQTALINCPSWSPALESILSANLPIKFMIRGRLVLNDIIGEDFYIVKNSCRDFRVLRNIINCEGSPRFPIILVNFHHTCCPPETVVKLCSFTSDCQGDKEMFYCRRPADLFLPQYLEKAKFVQEARGLRPKYNNKSQAIDLTQMSRRIKILAEIVYTELCGPIRGDQEQVCSPIAVKRHLNELKCALFCNIIPLGHIKVGGKFERALLFKALADQLGVPCTLERSSDGQILWNEVPLPTFDKIDLALAENSPSRLLKATHVLDLMNNPGELYPLDSREALEYTNNYL